MRARTPIPTSREPSYASSADEGFSQAGPASITIRRTERRMEAAEHVDCHQAQDDDQRGKRHYRCDLPRHAHAMTMRQNSITEYQARTQLSDLTAFAHEDLEAQLKTPPR